MNDVLIRHVRSKGNLWFHWFPDGLKMSGAVVGNPKFRGRWYE